MYKQKGTLGNIGAGKWAMSEQVRLYLTKMVDNDKVRILMELTFPVNIRVKSNQVYGKCLRDNCQT